MGDETFNLDDIREARVRIRRMRVVALGFARGSVRGSAEREELIEGARQLGREIRLADRMLKEE